MSLKVRPLALAAACAVLPACTGGGTATGGVGVATPGSAARSAAASPSACAGISPGPAPVRRLTRREYNNTIRDLLGETRPLADRFAPEEQELGFDNDAELLGVSTLLAEQQMAAAEAIAGRAVRDLPALLVCDPGRHAPEPCVRAFIARFGKRAWRRPLEPHEERSLFRTYQRARGWGDVASGVRAVVEALLQSPQFLFRVEIGLPPPPGRTVTRLTPYETASRLSYLLWGTMPDDELFAAADAGRLGTPEEIAAQASRLLRDDRARAVVADFHRQWLGLDRVRVVEKDAKRFPRFAPALRRHMERESAAFVEHVLWKTDGRLATLLTAPYSFVNAPLAAFYGVEGPPGDELQMVELDPAQRSGLLTRGGILTAHAKANQTSPIHRGLFVRRQLLCGAPPPPNEVFDPPALDDTMTTRERFEDHTADVGCNKCHRLFDPIGLAFEHYDAVGLYRETENGKPIDASGEIVGADVEGPFTGVVELGHRLAESRDAHRCVVTQWFRYAYGRTETDEDRCTLEALYRRFAAEGYDTRKILIALTQTDAFLYRKTEVPTP